MEETAFLIIEEAPVDFPSEVARSFDRSDAERIADALSDADRDVAYFVMTEDDFEAYRADFF